MTNNRSNRYRGASGRYDTSTAGQNNRYGMMNHDLDDDMDRSYGVRERESRDTYRPDRNFRHENMSYADDNDYGRYSTDRYSSGMGLPRDYTGQRYGRGYGMGLDDDYDDNYGSGQDIRYGTGRDHTYGSQIRNYGIPIYGDSRHVGANYGSSYYGGEHHPRNTGRYGYHGRDGYLGDDYAGSER